MPTPPKYQREAPQGAFRFSKEARRKFAREILQADKEPPEATFDNVDDMLDWLNDDHR